MTQKKSLGICIGASTIKYAILTWNGSSYSITKSDTIIHECHPKQTFLKLIDELKNDYDFICVTGRKFKDSVSLPTITEPEATEYALKHYLAGAATPFNSLISLGSENFILYELNSVGNIINVRVGNKCASGTGEFFLQQIRRMNVDVDSAIQLASQSVPYRVSGRCSVFCKSDCTHALNKGIEIGKVCAGLGEMISEKILELLKTTSPENVLLVGGVTKNSYVVDQLRNKINNLIIPDEANIFEAVGAAIHAHEKQSIVSNVMLNNQHQSFTYHRSLAEFKHLVTFKKGETAIAQDGDECLLGLDVGSTTTKAVLIRYHDHKVLASSYLRTNGNPIKASRACYSEIDRQVNGAKIIITGLGVTGSGRHIAGLHALTEGIINEIIAHATAATFYDAAVDTILEIGGQDAKYTFLINGVPCDYAMNEACSAGTGSFLEEAAKESLNIDYLDIQNVALIAKSPPNFNDQCAAFISSDIKNASHENISKEDIIAGLVYSICMNYNNRVKGARKIGNRVFMQGGVCYNQAVPVAMAAILQKEIIVPPEPGLMGAFGVALEVKSRIQLGLIAKKEFSLKDLSEREVEYGKSFNCAGGAERCDRKCLINIIKLNGKSYPFGGICNKYYNEVHSHTIDPQNFEYVSQRQDLVFNHSQVALNEKPRLKIGILRSYLTNTLYPLYHYFFSELGVEIVLSDSVSNEGMKKTSSAFCYPAELAHGMFANLLTKQLDYIFLPHVIELHVENSSTRKTGNQTACVFVQTEPSYLQSAFRNIKVKLLTPVLNFSKGWDTGAKQFIELAEKLGFDKNKASIAHDFAVTKFQETIANRKAIGDQFIKKIEQTPNAIGIVLFGRSYNAFADEANMGIPKKFASRGINIIPFDCLRFEQESNFENMGWASGQDLVRAAQFVKKHPKLYGVYVTNFSCGPDSFLVGYFRDIMQTKPSLTLELDSHSADAGINTRVEAFLDIVERYKKLQIKDAAITPFTPATIKIDSKSNKSFFIGSDGQTLPLINKKIKLLFPSMGKTIAEMAASTFNGIGFNSEAVPVPDFSTLMCGRSNTSCKECLPLILVTGSLLKAVANRANDDEPIVYFMPATSGNCRFSQYYVFLKRLIEKNQLKNVAVLTLTDDNGYAGIGPMNALKIVQGIIIADIMDDIKNTIRVLATDQKSGLAIYEQEWQKVLKCAQNSFKGLSRILKNVATNFAKIPLKKPLADAKKVMLAGEIYVRKDDFSTQEIIDRLAAKEIIALRSPIMEWLIYVDYMVKLFSEHKNTFKEKIEFFLRTSFQQKIENKVKRILATSGLYEHHTIDMAKILEIGSKLLPIEFTGESILVVGSFFKDIIHHVHGMISVGPFACLPTRIVESILSQESRIADNERLDFLPNRKDLEKFKTLPFISIECDGNPFPQIVESRLEAFCLQVERVKELDN